jgi:hypothetical protein
MIDRSVSVLHDTVFLFCSLGNRFGVPAQDLPHPDVDWNAFHSRISQLNDKEPLVWSSVTKAPAKWINMNHLAAVYGPKAAKGKGKDKDGKDCVVA